MESTSLAHIGEIRKLNRSFGNENMKLGFYFWLRSAAWLLLIILIQIVFSIFPTNWTVVINLLTTAIFLILLQIVGKIYARKRFGLVLLNSFWWSVFWRMLGLYIAYVLALGGVILILATFDMVEFLGLLILPVPDNEFIMGALAGISWNVLQISILGVVVPRGLEISLEKRYKNTPLWDIQEDEEEGIEEDPDPIIH